MTRAAQRSGGSRGFGALLALLALAMTLLSPAGFMVAPGKTGAAIVICTGHGPATMAPAQTDKSHHPSGKAGHDGSCAFAGHGVASAPPPLSVISRAAFRLAPPAMPRLGDLAPGRGLAAPPPPSQAPPLLV